MSAALEMGPPADGEDDPAKLWAEIHQLRAAVAGPHGHASWQAAAIAERAKHDQLRDAAENLVQAYRAKYMATARGRIRANAPLRQEVAELNAVLRA